MNIIAVDWAKHATKRSAYRSDLSTRAISRIPTDGSLTQLLEYAADLSGPTLIGIDAVVGYPAPAWRRLKAGRAPESGNFLDFLFGPSLPDRFFDPVKTPQDWRPEQPFISPPSARGYQSTIRPLTRDGGARLDVEGRLYVTVRGFHTNDLEGNRGRFWR